MDASLNIIGMMTVEVDLSNNLNIHRRQKAIPFLLEKRVIKK